MCSEPAPRDSAPLKCPVTASSTLPRHATFSIAESEPLPAHTPPSHGAKLMAEPSSARTMHDTLLPDGDLGTDLDAINPSLTDFDFQGELGAGSWEGWDRTREVLLAAWPSLFMSLGCHLLAPEFLVT